MKTSPPLGVAALVAALAATGCSAGASPRPELERSSRDGAIWVRPDDIERYVCTDGVFVCQEAVGRTSDRLCGCEAR
jgi:hypothetical protein